jgi:hypothetical protein
MKQTNFIKLILPSIIYLLVSILINLLIGPRSIFGSQTWVDYTPTPYLSITAWFITAIFFGYNKEGILEPGEAFFSEFIFFSLYQVVSFIIVNAITGLLTKKSLKQLLGN